MMQTYQISTRCSRCDILLDGREQFVGHMIHSHDMMFEHASAAWKSMCDSVDVANDRIAGGRGNDFIDGGDGNDRCNDRHGTNTVVNCEDWPKK